MYNLFTIRVDAKKKCAKMAIRKINKINKNDHIAVHPG